LILQYNTLISKTKPCKCENAIDQGFL